MKEIRDLGALLYLIGGMKNMDLKIKLATKEELLDMLEDKVNKLIKKEK